jgi:hypothetical protein
VVSVEELAETLWGAGPPPSARRRSGRRRGAGGTVLTLPLALRVVAELATARADLPLDALRDELADHQRRLELMDVGGDPRTGVRAVFSRSYRQLDADAARTFRLVGLHPGGDLDVHAAAALAGRGAAEVRGYLEALVRAHLVRGAGSGRYGLHDLLQAYARALAAEKDGGRDSAALTLATQIGDQEQQARAHDGLACCHRAGGEYGRSRDHWRQALTLYTELGAPEADQVRAQLAALPGKGLSCPARG